MDEEEHIIEMPVLLLKNGDTMNERKFVTYTGGELLSGGELCKRARKKVVLRAVFSIIGAALILSAFVILAIFTFAPFFTFEPNTREESGTKQAASLADSFFSGGFFLVALGVIGVSVLNKMGFLIDSLRREARVYRFTVTDKSIRFGRRGRISRFIHSGSLMVRVSGFDYARAEIGSGIYCAFVECDESESWFCCLGRFREK